MLERLLIAGMTALVSGAATQAVAQLREVRLGEQEIDLRRGPVEVDLSKARGSYRAFRVQAVKGNIFLTSVQFRYADGAFHTEQRGIKLTSDRSRPIASGAEKFVHGATLCFRRARGRVKLRIIGLQSRQGRRAKRPAITKRLTWPAACSGAQVVTAPPTTPIDARPMTPIAQAAAAAAGPVLPNGPVLFGVQHVGFVRDRDVISVGANMGQFERMQLRVLKNSIRIRELDIIYMDGSNQKLMINATVRRNRRTDWMEIDGTKFIREIRVIYRSRPRYRGQARIEVYGQHAKDWLGPEGRGRGYNEGWVLLGAQTANRYSRTKVDTIAVGRNQGKFKRLRVTVKDRSLVLDDIQVIYGDGAQEQIPVKTTVAANATYGPVDLKGGERVIKEIKARYRSAVMDAKAIGRGASVVEIWGQH